MVLATPVDGLFPAILCFITMENVVIHNLTMNQSAIIGHVIVIRTFAPIFPAFYPYFSAFSVITLCVRDYNILVHSRSLDYDTLFHLVPV